MIVCELREEVFFETIIPGDQAKATVVDTSPPLDITLDEAPSYVTRIYHIEGFVPIPHPEGWDRGWTGTNARNGIGVTLYCKEVR